MRCGRLSFKNIGMGLYATLSGALVLLTVVFSPATAESPADAKKLALEVVERNAEAIATVGDVLYYFGEPGMQEYESSKYLKTPLEQIGFKVELGGAGLPTNVWATWGSGKPVIAIATEMDALPERSEERRVGQEGRSRWSPHH